MLRPLYHREKVPRMDTRAGLDAVVKRINLCSCRESNPGCPTHSPVAILADLPQFLCKHDNLLAGFMLLVSFFLQVKSQDLFLSNLVHFLV